MPKESYTLGIDFGSQNIGISLVRHTDSIPNQPLYLGTIHVDLSGPEGLASKVDERKTMRRVRRTQDSKKRRLKHLKNTLNSIGIQKEAINQIVSFSRRRGYKWEQKEKRFDRKAKKEYFNFSGSRQEFLQSLNDEITKLVPQDKREQAFEKCKEILDKAPTEDIRPNRFNNRNPSKCRWKDCKNNVPAALNAIDLRLNQSLYIKLIPAFDLLKKNEAKKRELCEKIDSYISEFGQLAIEYQKFTEVEHPDKEEEKILNKKYSGKKADFKKYLLSLESTIKEEIIENLKKNFQNYYGKELDDIVKKQKSGRVSFCREHSPVYIQYMLAHKEILYKEDIEEKDIKSRQQQILFSKIWRFVEARLFPLTEGQINKIAVERNAFDLLAMPFDEKIELSEKKANELYWYGPQYGHKSTKEMLLKEFDGHCCYCPKDNLSENEAVEVEHILPRSRFRFNNYFNLTLACRDCNKRKGSNTALEAKMPITDKAYEAYCKYIEERESQKLKHVFHVIKKGILYAMTESFLKQTGIKPNAETQLYRIGKSLLEKTATQRGPRPLARYLRGKIKAAYGITPNIKYVNGRHTAVYRDLIFPEFDKLADKLSKEEGINHALDAALIAFYMPDYAWHEKRMYDYKTYEYWAERVKARAPKLDENGLPIVSPPEPISGFETSSKLNPSFYSIDILSTSWNRKHLATHKQEPFGITNEGIPIKRKTASDIIGEILKKEKGKYKKDNQKLKLYINSISHKALRNYLIGVLNETSPHEAVVTRLIEWLKNSIRGAMKGNKFSPHPSSQKRKENLEKFLNADINEILKSPEKFIPPNVGIKMLQSENIAGLLDLKRVDLKNICKKTGKPAKHYYMCQPGIKMKIVAYKADSKGTIDRDKPFVFDVKQNWAVVDKSNKKKIIVEDENHVLNGRVLSSGAKEKDFLRNWHVALNKYLSDNFGRWYFITQGNYIEYENGKGFFIKNFKVGDGYKNSDLRGIIKVYKSPYRWLNSQKNNS
ncbi:MAG: HNH endonuclease domain-containing protein [Nitrospirota bacterium]